MNKTGRQADAGRVPKTKTQERMQAWRHAARSLFGVGRPLGAAPQLGGGSAASEEDERSVTQLFQLRNLM